MNEEQANWSYAEDFLPEDHALLHARDVADELGCAPVFPGAGRMLTLLARLLGARAVVEIGTGAGVSTVYLLRGMDPSGVVTTIDREREHHQAAKQTLGEAGFGPERVRMIAGAALEVLPRLADATYDLVLVDARKKEYGDYVEHALRLLRPGGVMVLDNALWHGRVADPAQRDPDTSAIRSALKAVRENEDLVSALIPSGDGLLIAVKK